jgi:hypothetical protein
MKKKLEKNLTLTARQLKMMMTHSSVEEEEWSSQQAVCCHIGPHEEKAKEESNTDSPTVRLCAFCLLHDSAKMCGAKERQNNPACYAPGCKGRHIRKLHEFLKDMYGEENQVHLVQGDGEWEETECMWAADEEEEAMTVNTVQQAGSSWQEADNSWFELSGGRSGRGLLCQLLPWGGWPGTRSRRGAATRDIVPLRRGRGRLVVPRPNRDAT